MIVAAGLLLLSGFLGNEWVREVTKLLGFGCLGSYVSMEIMSFVHRDRD